MFVETITQPSDEWHRWNEKISMHSDPPAALVASVAWSSGDGMITALNVWDEPGAISDFYIERLQPIVEVEGEPENKPQRHGEPVSVYIRPS